MPFRILTVCTGNICRSPQAEQLLRARFAAAHAAAGPDAPWELPEVSSAGTRALVGEPMTEQAAKLSFKNGGDPIGHAGRLLTAALVEEADLILAMSREHRAYVAKLVPSASRRTFTLREFARVLGRFTELAGSTDTIIPSPGDFPEWMRIAASHRGFDFVRDPELDNIVDPYRRSSVTYATSLKQLLPAVEYTVHTIT